MGAETSPLGARLDSWKAIAAYLQRDIATVRRWEKSLGLPVRRVSGSGRGHSVFAYTTEIDAWLQSSKASATDEAAAPAEVVEPPVMASGSIWRFGVRRGLLAVAALTLATVAVVWLVRTRVVALGEMKVEASPNGVTASDLSGRTLWRYLFPEGEAVTLLDRDTALRVIGAGDPAVFVGTSLSHRRTDGLGSGGRLTWLDVDGRFRNSFEFDDVVSVQGTKFGPPWALTSYSIDESTGSRRIAVAGHHMTWDPSLITVLDAAWNRRGTFVHAGWVEAVRWLTPDQLLIGGFSNPHDGGMVGLLDASKLNGQGPEPPGSASHCESCGPVAAMKMAIMPRTEVNRATMSRFNRAVIEIAPDRIVARTVETDATDDGIHGGVVAIYEFTRDLELVSAKFSEQYWTAHSTLEAQGKLNHTRAQCPDREGPREIQMWSPAGGWVRQPITRLDRTNQ